jgi:Flp pilus assembly protein TadG
MQKAKNLAVSKLAAIVFVVILIVAVSVAVSVVIYWKNNQPSPSTAIVSATINPTTVNQNGTSSIKVETQSRVDYSQTITIEIQTGAIQFLNFSVGPTNLQNNNGTWQYEMALPPDASLTQPIKIQVGMISPATSETVPIEVDAYCNGTSLYSQSLSLTINK